MSGDMCNILYTFQLSSVFMNKIPQQTHHNKQKTEVPKGRGLTISILKKT